MKELAKSAMSCSSSQGKQCNGKAHDGLMTIPHSCKIIGSRNVRNLSPNVEMSVVSIAAGLMQSKLT